MITSRVRESGRLDPGEFPVWFDKADDRWPAEVDEGGRIALRGGRGGRAEHRAPAGGGFLEAPAGQRPVAAGRRAMRPCTQAIRGTSAHGWSARPTGSSMAARNWAPRRRRVAGQRERLGPEQAGGRPATAARPSSASPSSAAASAYRPAARATSPASCAAVAARARRIQPVGD